VNQQYMILGIQVYTSVIKPVNPQIGIYNTVKCTYFI